MSQLLPCSFVSEMDFDNAETNPTGIEEERRSTKGVAFEMAILAMKKGVILTSHQIKGNDRSLFTTFKWFCHQTRFEKV